jgi:glucose-1-phosphate thymidylyltransferase
MGELDVIGLVPAAGQAMRMGLLPCSKEVLPLGFRLAADGQPHSRVVCEYLLERFSRGGITRAYVIVREGKWDIPRYLGDGHAQGLHLGYLMMRHPHGVPFTLDQARPFVANCRVALGFPDILFEPADAYRHLLRRHEMTGADAVLGLFPAAEPRRMDMVDSDETGKVREIQVKPHSTVLRDTWVIAVWGKAFTAFMHELVQNWLREYAAGVQGEGFSGAHAELHVGDVVNAAIDAGLVIQSLRFPSGRCIDVGTSQALRRVQGDWSSVEF